MRELPPVSFSFFHSIWLDWFLFRYLGNIRIWFDFLKFRVVNNGFFSSSNCCFMHFQDYHINKSLFLIARQEQKLRKKINKPININKSLFLLFLPVHVLQLIRKLVTPTRLLLIYLLAVEAYTISKRNSVCKEAEIRAFFFFQKNILLKIDSNEFRLHYLLNYS